LDYLTPRAFAFWFLDDGGRASYNKASQNQGFEFHTQSFSFEIVSELNRALKDKYDINGYVNVKDGQLSLYHNPC
jgi:hypothetical protein